MAAESKPQPKVNISARVSLETLALLQAAAEETGKTQSSLVEECIARVLGKKGKAAK